MGIEIQQHQTPSAGLLLVAEPYLSDSNFSRTVIFLCEHGDEGTIGFVLNKETELKLPQLLPQQVLPDLPIHQGGPVQLDTLHMLHQSADIFSGKEIATGLYWGGAFEILAGSQQEDKDELKEKIKLFLGYSGWAVGQLEEEIKEGSWLITDAPPELVFHTPADEIWKNCMLALGSDYRLMANSPLDPQFN